MTSYQNARCNICNAVSHAEIAKSEEGWTQGYFLKDPGSDFGYICSPCASAVKDVRTEWDQEDQADD